MTFIIAIGLAGALSVGAITQSGNTNPRDPLLGDLVADPGDQAGDLYARLRAETRDTPWTASAETALLNRFGTLSGITSLRATCGATLCEIAGVLKPGSASGDALLAVEGMALHGLRDVGFADVASFSVGGATSGGGVPLVAYPRRVATDVPRVIGTSPAQDARVAPGALTVSVTFDRPMRSGGYSFVQRDRGDYPFCDGKPKQSADGRTFTMACMTMPRRAYVIGFNGPQFHKFVSAADSVPAEPAILSFTTTR